MSNHRSNRCKETSKILKALNSIKKTSTTEDSDNSTLRFLVRSPKYP